MASRYELRSSKASVSHVYEEGITGRSGIDSADLQSTFVSVVSMASSDSFSASDIEVSVLAFVRAVRLGGIHRSLYGAFIISWLGSDDGMTVGVLKSTTYGAGGGSAGDGITPWVRRCRVALERTVKVLGHPGNPQGKAVPTSLGCQQQPKTRIIR